jgi:hypothetical protein
MCKGFADLTVGGQSPDRGHTGWSSVNKVSKSPNFLRAGIDPQAGTFNRTRRRPVAGSDRHMGFAGGVRSAKLTPRRAPHRPRRDGRRVPYERRSLHQQAPLEGGET